MKRTDDLLRALQEEWEQRHPDHAETISRIETILSTGESLEEACEILVLIVKRLAEQDVSPALTFLLVEAVNEKHIAPSLSSDELKDLVATAYHSFGK